MTEMLEIKTITYRNSISSRYSDLFIVTGNVFLEIRKYYSVEIKMITF